MRRTLGRRPVEGGESSDLRWDLGRVFLEICMHASQAISI